MVSGRGSLISELNQSTEDIADRTRNCESLLLNIAYPNTFEGNYIKLINILFIEENCVMSFYQGSHRSGNSGKILKTFSSQGNQGKTGVFQPKSGKKISNQGTFFPNHFQTF